MEGIRHLALVVHPQLQGVLLEVELVDEFLAGKAPDTHVVDNGVGRHEGKVCRARPHPLFLHHILLGGALAEEVQFYLGMAGQAKGGILHVKFLELIKAVVVHDGGPQQTVQEGDAFALGVVFVVVVLVLDGIHAVQGVRDVPDGEETPVVRSGGGYGPFQEHGRI